MIWVVLIFLGISLFFYCVLGGADFGAGALEFFIPAKHRPRHEELVNKAMGPVWEANHIWLIILIVILFNGFPRVYAQYSIYFHIPLLLMLIGIVFRGCAFTFRHYDAVKDHTHRYYSRAFAISSLLTPIMFGMIMGGMFYGVDPMAQGYYQKYVASWFNLFSLMVGIFVLSMFTYLASVYLIGESEDKSTRDYYLRCGQKASIVMLMAGVMVFLSAQLSHRFLFELFFTNIISVICFILATVLAFILHQRIGHTKMTEWGIRLMAGAQMGLVLGGWVAVIYPDVLFYSSGGGLSLLSSAAPSATITILGWSLMIGASLFLPILFYLIRVFKIIQ